ncbi:MAG: hypothetical protein EBS23_05950 [Betaproteobacteria bacterium]|nr:hypothetical protein [Betaproteobacteria bacterium]
MTYTIDITDDYVTPEGPMADNQAYLTFVMNKAAESYRNQYAVADKEAGITAAREAYNAALPAPQEETPDAA